MENVQAKPVNRGSVESYSSFSSCIIQDEHDGTLSIHQLKEKPQFSFQEAKEPNGGGVNAEETNNQHNQKQLYETVQDLLYTEEKLELPAQQLKQIPKLQQNFVNIKLLNLMQNQLTTVPPQIMRMSNLKKLILSSNQITVLPMFLQTLKYLEYLDMQDNLIKVFNINPPELKYLNIANNLIEQLYFPNLEHLCIQMNCFTIIPKGFHKVLYGMHHFEFDWFKYCKPALPVKINFEKYQHVKDKLIALLSSNSLTFEGFVRALSLSEPNFRQTDYKYRNLFFQAASSNEIGVIYCLIQIIPELLNSLDFDQNTPLSACYLEGKVRSVTILRSLGGRFAPQSIQAVCQKVDLPFFKIILNLKDDDNSVTKHTDLDLINHRNIDGNTPLHQLLMNFNKNDDAKEIANILLNLGADPNVENNEGWSPLDLAVRKGQAGAIQYAAEYNKRYAGLRSTEQLFDFHKKSGVSEWSLGHVAASVGNIEILELLSQINIDMFQVSKCNRLPRNLAIQSLTMLKNMRKLEKRWIWRNLLIEGVSLEQSEKNVYQMKHQIEKNMTKRYQNFVQKLVEVEEDNFDLDDGSLKVASENSIKDIVSESAPIFQRLANKQITKMQIEKQNMSSLDTIDFADHLPEIQKYLRNRNYDLALQKLKHALLSDMLPLSERLKYKNFLNLISFKLKYSRVEMQTYLRNSLNLVLSEFQFKQIPHDQKSKLIKELNSTKKEQQKNEIFKIQFSCEKLQLATQNPMLHQDLLVQDLIQINELRSRLSNNLIYDITNYGEGISHLNDLIFYWVNSNFGHNTDKIIINSNLLNVLNFESLQKMRFAKKLKNKEKDYDNIEQDMIEPESQISSYQQFTYIITPFQNSKRF